MRMIKIGLVQQANTEDIQQNMQKLSKNIAEVARQ